MLINREVGEFTKFMQSLPRRIISIHGRNNINLISLIIWCGKTFIYLFIYSFSLYKECFSLSPKRIFSNYMIHVIHHSLHTHCNDPRGKQSKYRLANLRLFYPDLRYPTNIIWVMVNYSVVATCVFYDSCNLVVWTNTIANIRMHFYKYISLRGI